jgi:uncharacterized membrane protein YkvA (DUF1232 family)
VKFLESLKEQARALKTKASVLMIAYKDKRTPLLAKILIGVTIGYLLSPIDLIPDFIPVLGWLDDLILVPLLIKASISLLPEVVLSDAQKQFDAGGGKYAKTNWIFAVCIVLCWLLIFVFAYLKVRSWPMFKFLP